jgi:hypothetical protein
MYKPITAFSGKADLSMTKPGRRGLAVSSAPRNPKRDPHVRPLDYVRGVFISSDALQLASPRPTFRRNPRRTDLGIVREIP